MIQLLPFELGPGNQDICLKGETQIAGLGGHLPDGFAPQDSYCQAVLTTVYAHMIFSLSGVFLFANMLLHAGTARETSKTL